MVMSNHETTFHIMDYSEFDEPHSNQNLYYIFVHEYFRMYMQRKFQIVFTDYERPRNVQIRILLIISVYHLNIIIHIHTEISWTDALLTA